MTVVFFFSLIKIYYDASDAPAKVSSIHLSVIDGRVTVGWSLSSSAHIEQHVLYILDMEQVEHIGAESQTLCPNFREMK